MDYNILTITFKKLYLKFINKHFNYFLLRKGKGKLWPKNQGKILRVSSQYRKDQCMDSLILQHCTYHI
jgi:hypothetical protein